MFKNLKYGNDFHTKVPHTALVIVEKELETACVTYEIFLDGIVINTLEINSLMK